MKPDFLVPANRKSAVHFTKRAIVDSPLFGPMETYAIACGQKLDARRWQTGATREPHLVTCVACWPIANPPKNPYAA